MNNQIHKTSIISPNANIHKDVSIGAFCIIEDNVTIGKGTIVKPYVQIKSNTKIGKNNLIYQGSVIGENPQDLKYNGEETFLEIGDNNTIREFCTLNRGTDYSYKTVIGSDCLFMAYVHVAHDCVIEDKVILANGVQLGGHVEVGYHATIGGMSPVHQFCRIGSHSFIGGHRIALQDVPPYILATGEPLQFAGLNNIGLRRRGFKPNDRAKIKSAYKLIYKSKYNIKDALKKIKDDIEISDEISNIINFIENSDRGII